MVCKYLFSIQWIQRVSEPNNNISLRARVGQGELIGPHWRACESVLTIRAKTILSVRGQSQHYHGETHLVRHSELLCAPPAITLQTRDFKQYEDQPRIVHYRVTRVHTYSLFASIFAQAAKWN